MVLEPVPGRGGPGGGTCLFPLGPAIGRGGSVLGRVGPVVGACLVLELVGVAVGGSGGADRLISWILVGEILDLELPEGTFTSGNLKRTEWLWLGQRLFIGHPKIDQRLITKPVLFQTLHAEIPMRQRRGGGGRGGGGRGSGGVGRGERKILALQRFTFVIKFTAAAAVK